MTRKGQGKTPKETRDDYVARQRKEDPEGFRAKNTANRQASRARQRENEQLAKDDPDLAALQMSLQASNKDRETQAKVNAKTTMEVAKIGMEERRGLLNSFLQRRRTSQPFPQQVHQKSESNAPGLTSVSLSGGVTGPTLQPVPEETTQLSTKALEFTEYRDQHGKPYYFIPRYGITTYERPQVMIEGSSTRRLNANKIPMTRRFRTDRCVGSVMICVRRGDDHNPNLHWSCGTELLFPLTLEATDIYFNCDEEWTMSAVASKLAQNLFERIPNVTPQKSLGKVLEQIEKDLSPALRRCLKLLTIRETICNTTWGFGNLLPCKRSMTTNATCVVSFLCWLRISG